MSIRALWPFRRNRNGKAPKPKSEPRHNRALRRALSRVQVQRIRAQDEKDAKLYQEIESYCQDLRAVQARLAK